MSKTYTIMPLEWDYEYPELSKAIKDSKCFVPCEIQEVKDKTGFIGCMSQKNAIEKALELKQQFPFIKFSLFTGDTWGNLELVKEF